MSKAKLKTFSVSVKLNLDIGFEVKAITLQDAIAQVEAMQVSDIVDFSANGWDHNDSDKQVTGAFVL